MTDLERLFTAFGSTVFLCRSGDTKPSMARRDDIFPDLHGLDLKGRPRAAFLTDRGLRLPVFLFVGQR